MKLRLTLVAVLCAAVAGAGATLAPGARGAEGSATYYLSLGDSLAASIQPDGDRAQATSSSSTPRLQRSSRGCAS
jgi:hypothetical protein